MDEAQFASDDERDFLRSGFPCGRECLRHWREADLFCLRHRMLVVQMAVRFYRQSAADFVAEPAADRGDIDAGFIAGGRKEIAEIPVPASGEKSNGCWPKRRKRHTLCRLLCMIVTPFAVAF